MGRSISGRYDWIADRGKNCMFSIAPVRPVRCKRRWTPRFPTRTIRKCRHTPLTRNSRFPLNNHGLVSVTAAAAPPKPLATTRLR
jgi:hypothetical protein